MATTQRKRTVREPKVEPLSDAEKEMLLVEDISTLTDEQLSVRRSALHKQMLGARTRKRQLETHAKQQAIREKDVEKHKNLGLDPGKRRLDALEQSLRAQWEDMEDPPPPEEIDELVAVEMARCRERYEHLDREAKKHQALLPLSRAELPDRDVRVRAVLSHPRMRFLRGVLEYYASPPERDGRKSFNPRLTVMVFLWMAIAGDPPVVHSALRGFKQNIRRAWATCHPGPGPGRTGSITRAIQKMLGRLHLEQRGLIEHQMAAAASQLAFTARDPKHVKSGKLVAVCEQPMDVLVGDAQVIVAHQPQRSAPNPALEEIWQHFGKWAGTAFLVYAAVRSYGQPTWSSGFSPDGDELRDTGRLEVMRALIKKGRGWKLVSIGCAKLGITLIARLFPATVDEREAYLILLEELLERLLPELKPTYLCIDSIADVRSFVRLVRERYGVVVVCPRGAPPGKDWWHTDPEDDAWPGSWGVPMCCNEYMLQTGHDGWGTNHVAPGAEESDRDRIGREELGRPIRNGEVLRRHMPCRIRWRCAVDKKHTRSTQATENERLYTYLPRISLDDLIAQRDRMGEGYDDARPGRVYADHWAAEHLVLQGVRNNAEMLFSVIERDFLRGAGSGRAAWAGTKEMGYLLPIHELARTVLKICWLDGSLEQFAQEAEELDLDAIPVWDSPLPGDLKAALRRHRGKPMQGPRNFSPSPDLAGFLHEWDEMPPEGLVERVTAKRTAVELGQRGRRRPGHPSGASRPRRRPE